jgi:tyrosine-protein kinase Etk/Wzc
MAETLEAKQRPKLMVTPREVIFKYIRYIPWVAASVLLMMVGAYVKLRYSPTIYNVSGKLLATQGQYRNGNEKFDDIFMMQQGDKINDEIELIKSRSMATRVIRSLGLQKRVYNKGNIRNTIIHPVDAAFDFEILRITDSLSGFSLLVTVLNNQQFQLNEQPQKYYFNQLIELPAVTFRIKPTAVSMAIFSSPNFIVSWSPIEGMANGLSKSIAVGRVNDFSNVLLVSHQTENPRQGVDIVNQYMKEYQESSLEDKKQIAARTLAFIDEQLDTVRYQLGGVERNLQQYRQQNRVINPETQTQLFLSEMSDASKALSEQNVKLRIIDYLISYLSNTDNRYKIISSMLGITEASLLAQVTQFNKLQLERELALKDIPAKNPYIIGLETEIEKLRSDMIQNLTNTRQTVVLTLSELSGKARETDKLIASVPSKEKQLLEVTRQQNILQELYQYLLQKKLETSIASASTISNIKVVESAMGSGGPISPNRRAMYLFAIVLGIGIPVAIVFMLEYFNDKVKGKNDIEQLTQAPVLGEIGHAKEASALVVTRNNRKFLAEQFRIIRSNLKYILPQVEKPVLLVTSSFSGEGKSFISTNLGSVLALSGKKTVILEFDIRKPKIMKGLGLNERKGITNFIVGNIELQEVIHPVPDVENLYVIPCGPVPPNPAEMLLSDKIEQMFKELRRNFDAIIIDSAPVGLVSDAVTLSRQADATIYIVRHNYTLKKQVGLIDDLYSNNKLPHIAIIINDISSRGGYGGYGYGGYGYGYGYGYGFGFKKGDEEHGYFDKEKRKQSGWLKWFKRSS